MSISVASFVRCVTFVRAGLADEYTSVQTFLERRFRELGVPEQSFSSGFSSQVPIPASHRVTLGTLQGLSVILCIWSIVSSSVCPLSTYLFFQDIFLAHILCGTAVPAVWQRWERGQQESALMMLSHSQRTGRK